MWIWELWSFLKLPEIRLYIRKQVGNHFLGTQETYQPNKKSIFKARRTRVWWLDIFWIWQKNGAHINPFHSAHESDAWLWHLEKPCFWDKKTCATRRIIVVKYSLLRYIHPNVDVFKLPEPLWKAFNSITTSSEALYVCMTLM